MSPCPAVDESLAQLNAHWVEAPGGGPLVPLMPMARAFGSALAASNVLKAHGWSHRNCVKIRDLRTMLLLEQTIPGGH